MNSVWLVIIYNSIREENEIKGIYDFESKAIARAKNIADTTRNAPAIIEWELNTERRSNRKYYVEVLDEEYDDRE